MISRRRFLQAALVVPAGGLGLLGYAFGIEPHWLTLVRRPLHIRGLPPALAGRLLAQLSDLHIGSRVSEDYLLRVFRRVTAIEPDLAVYTGDFISYEPGIHDRLGRLLPHLPKGRLATLGILGNHDYGPGWSQPAVADRLTEQVAAAGVRVLRNEIQEILGLQVVGLDDLWAGRFAPARALAGLDPGKPALALSHNPDSVDLPGWERFRGWILSGHTHGGQCRPPFLPPPLLPVRNRRYTEGEFTLEGGRQLYISRGVGHLLRVRFNARPEVTLFRLQPA